jgi:hypothetical protein
MSATSPEQRYQTDPTYHGVVDMLEAMVRQCMFSPSEIREAAVLACIHYELRQETMPIAVPEDVFNAFQTIERWRDRK